jgi:hypothetical protein
MESATDTKGTRRTLLQIGRVRRGWLFRDRLGCGWWLDDSIVTNGAHRVVPVGHPSAQCRVFTPMVGAREAGRRVYRFAETDEHGVSLHSVDLQLARSVADPPADSC